MRLSFLLLFAGMACAALLVNRVYSDPTPTPTSQPLRLTPTPASQPRIDIDPTEANMEPPADTNISKDGLGFYGAASVGNTAVRAATLSSTISPQATPANATIQNTVTAILSNPGLSTKDELTSGKTPAPSGLVPTNLVLEPTDTPIPSLLDKY